MKVKVTDVGDPMILSDGRIGFNVGVEYAGRRFVALIHRGDDLKRTIYRTITKDLKLAKDINEAAYFAEQVKKLIGSDIEVP